MNKMEKLSEYFSRMKCWKWECYDNYLSERVTVTDGLFWCLGNFLSSTVVSKNPCQESDLKWLSLMGKCISGNWSSRKVTGLWEESMETKPHQSHLKLEFNYCSSSGFQQRWSSLFMKWSWIYVPSAAVH